MSPTLRPRNEFVSVLIAWMSAATVVLVLTDALSYELFFAISFIGLIVTLEYTSPAYVTPAWRRRLRWVALCGFAVFGYIVANRFLLALAELT